MPSWLMLWAVRTKKRERTRHSLQKEKEKEQPMEQQERMMRKMKTEGLVEFVRLDVAGR